MSFHNKEFSNYSPLSVSGCATPLDGRSLKVFPPPVSLWLQVLIPYFKKIELSWTHATTQKYTSRR